MAKKFLSLILTLSMVASLFAGLSFTASAITAYATENLDGLTVNHYINSSSTPSDSHAGEVKLLVTDGAQLVNDTTRLDYVQYNFGVATRDESTGTITEGDWAKTNANGTNHILSQMQTMVNSPYGSTDIGCSFKDAVDTTLVHGRDEGGFYTINSNKEKVYRDVANTDDNFIRKAYFEYNVGKGVTITDIIVGSASGGYRTGYYTVLTSNNGKDWTKQYAYACDRKVDGTNSVNSGIQHLKFSTPVTASMVRVEVYAHINSLQLSNAYSGQVIRMKCLQVYGTRANYVYSSNEENDISNHSSDNATYTTDTLKPKWQTLVNGRASLIASKMPSGLNYFVSEEGAVNTAFDTGDGVLDDTFTYGSVTNAMTYRQCTNVTDGSMDADSFVFNGSALRRMFFTNPTTSNVIATDLINDESKQFVQIDYKLDAETEITDLALIGKANQAWSPSHYKYYISDTAEGLYDETNCVAEVHSGSRIASVTFDTPVKGKYVGLRIICGYNPNNATQSFTSASGMYLRFTEFQVFGNYTNPIGTLTATATAEGVDGVEPTASVAYNSNVDSSNKYPSATVTLSTPETVTQGDKEYVFTGWYLGENKVVALANGTYTATVNDDEELAFVAKYEAPNCVITGVNNKDEATLANGYNVEPKNSLLAGATNIGVYMLNTDENDAEELRATTPTKLADNMIKNTTLFLTSASEINNDVAIFSAGTQQDAGPARALANAMFVQHNGATVTALDAPDENKQWLQINYKLPAEASITDMVLACNKMTNDSISRWTPSSYVYILADSEEDLLNDNGTKIYVNHNADTIKNITKVELIEATTAKYIGIRFLQLYNDYASPKMSNDFNLGLVLYARFNHFDIHGTYLTSATEDITAKAVDAEGADVDIDATATKTGVGGYDNNGDYVKYTVALAAEETKTIGDYEYTFAGWYKNDEADAVLATASGNVTVTDGEAVVFTAKYTKTLLVKSYTLSFVDATKTVIGTIVVEEGQIPSELDVKAINAKVKDIYGYTVVLDDDDMVVWDAEVFEEVSADKTFVASYRAKDMSTAVTLYKLDSKTEYYYHGTQKFDTAINLVLEGANSWTDENDVVLVAAPTGTLYACGSRMKIYPKSAIAEAQEIAIVGKDHKEGEGFSIFAHVDAENVTEFGVIFSSSTGHTLKPDFDVTDAEADTEGKRYKKVAINAANVGASDFMGTLNYNPENGNPTRWARAYVKVGDTYIYTDAICNK